MEITEEANASLGKGQYEKALEVICDAKLMIEGTGGFSETFDEAVDETRTAYSSKAEELADEGSFKEGIKLLRSANAIFGDDSKIQNRMSEMTGNY